MSSCSVSDIVFPCLIIRTDSCLAVLRLLNGYALKAFDASAAAALAAAALAAADAAAAAVYAAKSAATAVLRATATAAA